jgi:hypothetical protein
MIEMPTFQVVKVSEEEDSKGDRRGVVALTAKTTRGRSTIKLTVEQDEAQEFELGEYYTFSYKMLLSANNEVEAQ